MAKQHNTARFLLFRFVSHLFFQDFEPFTQYEDLIEYLWEKQTIDDVTGEFDFFHKVAYAVCGG